MEISVIKTKGIEVQVVFTGSQYVFLDSFCGVAAVATRSGYNTEEEESHFIVSIGNAHNLGSCFLHDDAMLRIAKRFITKNENKYIKKSLSFTVEKKPLETAYVTLTVNYR